MGLLISSPVAMGAKPPEVLERIKGRLMSCKLRLHHEWPLITVAVCYGSNIKEERNEIESVLSKLSEQPLLVGGDLMVFLLLVSRLAGLVMCCIGNG